MSTQQLDQLTLQIDHGSIRNEHSVQLHKPQLPFQAGQVADQILVE